MSNLSVLTGDPDREVLMATAKKDPTDPRVQGPRDALDKLVAIAARIAEREGLLIDDSGDTAPTGREIDLWRAGKSLGGAAGSSRG